MSVATNCKTKGQAARQGTDRKTGGQAARQKARPHITPTLLIIGLGGRFVIATSVF